MKQKTLQQVENETKDLVLFSHPDYNKAELITTSDKIAKYCGYDKRVVHRLIKNHLEDLKSIDERPVVLKTQGQFGTKDYQSFYILTEQQSYFLLTLMDNNKVVIEFKKKLIKEFFVMRNLLHKQLETRPIAKAIQKDFHDTINIFNGGEENEFIHWSYKLYNDLVYKKVIGETAKQRRARLGLKNDYNIMNTLNADELIKKDNLEQLIKHTAIKNNWHKLSSKECYNKVREFLQLDK